MSIGKKPLYGSPQRLANTLTLYLLLSYFLTPTAYSIVKVKSQSLLVFNSSYFSQLAILFIVKIRLVHILIDFRLKAHVFFSRQLIEIVVFEKRKIFLQREKELCVWEELPHLWIVIYSSLKNDEIKKGLQELLVGMATISLPSNLTVSFAGNAQTR